MKEMPVNSQTSWRSQHLKSFCKAAQSKLQKCSKMAEQMNMMKEQLVPKQRPQEYWTIHKSAIIERYARMGLDLLVSCRSSMMNSWRFVKEFDWSTKTKMPYQADSIEENGKYLIPSLLSVPTESKSSSRTPNRSQTGSLFHGRSSKSYSMSSINIESSILPRSTEVATWIIAAWMSMSSFTL